MMEALFAKEDFTLCVVPVPKGYPQSQTHAGVAISGNRVYLTTSPFPIIKYGLIRRVINKVFRTLTKGVYPPMYGDAQENPMLYWGGENETCPTGFTPYIGNPLASTPPKLFGYHSYNSDPDIFIEGEDVYILNRECYRKSTDGDCWCRIMQYHFKAVPEGAEYVDSKVLLETPSIFLSPSLTKMNGVYSLFYLETTSYNTGDSQCRLYVRFSNNVDGPYDDAKEIFVSSGSFVPWHLSIFIYKGEMYSIVACIKKGMPKHLFQMFGKFNKEMDSLTIYQRPLIEIPSYRGAAYVTEKGMFVLYSTTDKYRISGSTSLDGRDIIMMKKEFKELQKAII